VTNTQQQRISKTRLGAASPALTLAVVLVLSLVATQSAQAQTFTVLYNFTGSPDGASPTGSLIQDSAGNLYGTTYYGGASNNGTVFKVDTSGTETVLYNFCSVSNCADGANPSGSLIQDSAGNLYGNASGGGANLFSGVVFKVDTSGTETVLYNFCSVSNCADGANPSGRLIHDSAGNLYGTTYYGGDFFGCNVGSGCGVVFKLDTSGTETVLHTFTYTDGTDPDAGVIMDAKGNLYGDTTFGGTGCPTRG